MILPPASTYHFFASFQDLARIVDSVSQDSDLAGDKSAIMRIIGQGAHVNDVGASREKKEELGKLGEDEGFLDANWIGREARGWRKGPQAELNVLGAAVSDPL